MSSSYKTYLQTSTKIQNEQSKKGHPVQKCEKQAVGNVRKVVPVHIASGFCSAGCPYYPAGGALLQCGQQQATQVCMPKEVCPNLALHSTVDAITYCRSFSKADGLESLSALVERPCSKPSSQSCPAGRHLAMWREHSAVFYLKAVLCHLIFHHPYSCIVG